LGSLDSDDESSFEEDIVEYEEKAEDDPQEILLNLENQIKELKDHRMDLIIEEETPMQILNLTLQEQHQNVLERLLSKDDDYADWIKCVAVEEIALMQQKLGKNIEPNAHLYLVQVFDDLIEGGDKWTQIKNRIRLDKSLNEKQQNQLWGLLEKWIANSLTIISFSFLSIILYFQGIMGNKGFAMGGFILLFKIIYKSS
jgi:hypothetical protein